MASVTSPPVLKEKGITALSEVLFQETYSNPDLASVFNIKTGIKGQTQIGILSKIQTGLSGYNRSACDVTADTSTYTGSSKTWVPKYVSSRNSTCWDTFSGTFFQWGFKNGIAREDLTDTDWATFMSEVLPHEINETIMRVAWFNDTAAVAGTDNNISVGNLKYFTVIDGIWKQLYAIVTASAARLTVNTTVQTRNAAASFAAQAFTTADVTNKIATALLDSMYYGADMTLRSRPKSELAFYVTQTVADQYEKELKANATIPLSYTRIETGIDVLMSNGIKVIPMNFWDRMITGYFAKAATNLASYLPHRALLTTASDNLMIGTEDTTNMNSFDMFYDKATKANIVDYGVFMDAKVGHDLGVQLGY